MRSLPFAMLVICHHPHHIRRRMLLELLLLAIEIANSSLRKELRFYLPDTAILAAEFFARTLCNLSRHQLFPLFSLASRIALEPVESIDNVRQLRLYHSRDF